VHKNRVVVVTGGAGEIGAKIVERFIHNGDVVIAIDRDKEALERLLETRNPVSQLTVFAGDISREKDVRGFAENIRSTVGRVDVLVNCAGYYPIVRFEEMTFENWQEVVAINLSGAFLMTHTLFSLLKGRGWGRIVNIGSASIFEGVPGQTHYVAAKAGLVGFTRSLAMELGEFGITVNLIAPGLTVTEPIRREMPSSMIESQKAVRAIKRDEQPGDLAGPVFFLASPDADFMSGQVLVVDGGKVKN
jgi:3-oxoacyl-[acyl-carrier protein] reductase